LFFADKKKTNLQKTNIKGVFNANRPYIRILEYVGRL